MWFDRGGFPDRQTRRLERPTDEPVAIGQQRITATVFEKDEPTFPLDLGAAIAMEPSHQSAMPFVREPEFEDPVGGELVAFPPGKGEEPESDDRFIGGEDPDQDIAPGAAMIEIPGARPHVPFLEHSRPEIRDVDRRMQRPDRNIDDVPVIANRGRPDGGIRLRKKQPGREQGQQDSTHRDDPAPGKIPDSSYHRDDLPEVTRWPGLPTRMEQPGGS